jgi:hypothetical protein
MDILRRAWVWGLIGFAGVMILYLILAALGWPGNPDSCTLPGGNCYCEAYPPLGAFVIARQPVNTWSGLTAVIAGLVVLAIADRDRDAGTASSPMASGRFYALIYGGLVVFLGPGSMFFHGSLTHYGGWLDNFSMIMYVTFILAYDAFRIWGWDDRHEAFAATFIGVNILLGLLTWFAEGSGTILFAILAGVAVITEGVILVTRPAGIARRFSPWMLSALIAFGIAIVIWALSATGRPLCDPGSPFQGHALWHLLAMALTPLFIFLYLRDESTA